MKAFSFNRFAALLRKEWLQVVRDPITLRFIIALPMMQLFLFGYAINTDPKNLPAGLLSVEHSKYERTILAALRNTGYFNISILSSEAEAERLLAQGKLLFVINIPPKLRPLRRPRRDAVDPRRRRRQRSDRHRQCDRRAAGLDDDPQQGPAAGSSDRGFAAAVPVRGSRPL